ncbi:hypothetical protein ACJIZ3_008425 [Penstemon smallii]|uniref:Uncharacterized protein n=1 Tax=Penstemon smallii TaxID=265156 RepID=A0ABD3T9T3_9LAMI
MSITRHMAGSRHTSFQVVQTSCALSSSSIGPNLCRMFAVDGTSVVVFLVLFGLWSLNFFFLMNN